MNINPARSIELFLPDLPPNARNLLLEKFPEHRESIRIFSETECDRMLSLSNSLTKEQSEIVISSYRPFLELRPNLFLYLIVSLSRYMDQSDEIFQKVSEGFSLTQSIFLEKYSELNSPIYLDQVKKISEIQCLTALDRGSFWLKVFLHYRECSEYYNDNPECTRALNLRVDNVSDLINLSDRQCEVAKKIVENIFYENQFDICRAVQNFSDQECDWALQMIENIEQTNQLEEVIDFTSNGLEFHQALVLVRFSRSPMKEKEKVGKLSYTFQSISASKFLLQGSDFQSAIHRATSSLLKIEGTFISNFSSLQFDPLPEVESNLDFERFIESFDCDPEDSFSLVDDDQKS